MRFLLFLVLVLCLVQSGLACGKKRKKPGQNNPTGCQAGAIGCLVGKDVTTNPYAGGPDQPGDCSQLKCDEASSCCWSNNQPPADQLNWVQGGGTADPALLKKNFGTDQAPSGNFFVTASDVAGDASQTAQLYSCPITCSNGDITVKAKHWASKGTKIQVCSATDPASPPSNCQDLPATNGQSDQVTIPKGDNQRIVIQAVGFQEKTGTAAMVDDIEVTCDPCPGSTTQAATPGPSQPPAGQPPCKEISCNFEQGNPCSYTPASGGGSASDNWGTHEPVYQNRLTGISKAAEGNKFGAAYVKKKGEKSTLETNANFDKDYVVRYQYYKATEGVTFKGCCNDESSCPKDSTGAVQTADYRTWKTESILCPAGTKKVLFLCENLEGASEGACGIDNIQLLQATGGDPKDANAPAC